MSIFLAIAESKRAKGKLSRNSKGCQKEDGEINNKIFSNKKLIIRYINNPNISALTNMN